MKEYQIKRMDDEDVLILGGMGAIGSNIAHSMVRLGAKVTIFDNMMEGTGANPANIKEIKDKIKFVKGDIRDFEELKKVIKNKRIIYNCAAQVSHVLSMENPFLDIDINCRGQINVLECCRRCNDSAKIVYTGTRSQFGIPQMNPLTEECIDSPVDVYSANKLASELYHLIYYNAYGIKATSLRMTNTYGPRAQMRNPTYNFVNWLIAKAIMNEELTVFEPGTQVRDLNYVDNAIDAIILASQNERTSGEVYLVGSGNGISIIELAKIIVEIAKSGKVKIVPYPKNRKSAEVGDVVIDYSKIKKATGWFPKTSIREGIKKTINFYRKRFNEYF